MFEPCFQFIGISIEICHLDDFAILLKNPNSRDQNPNKFQISIRQTTNKLAWCYASLFILSFALGFISQIIVSPVIAPYSNVPSITAIISNAPFSRGIAVTSLKDPQASVLAITQYAMPEKCGFNKGWHG